MKEQGTEVSELNTPLADRMMLSVNINEDSRLIAWYFYPRRNELSVVGYYFPESVWDNGYLINATSYEK